MLSYIYEGDLRKLGGGVIITKPLKKSLFSSKFECDLYFKASKSPFRCTIRVPVYGGYEVIDIPNDKQLALDTLFELLKNDKDVLFTYYMRWIFKFILFVFSIALPIFFFMFIGLFDLNKIILNFFIICAFEISFYFINGFINKL